MSLLFTSLIRGALLERGLPADAPAPSAALRHRLYLAAISLVPPNASSLRGDDERKHLSDEELLSDFLDGDSGSFALLRDKHLSWMVAWAYRQLPPEEANDAIQETFFDLFRKASELDPTVPLGKHLRGMLRIAVVRARSKIARRREELIEGDVDELHGFVEPDSGPEIAFLKRQAYQEVADALLRTCNLEEQEVVLFTLEEQGDRTIAQALGITENLVRVRRSRALARLRKAFTGTAPPYGDDHH